MQKDYLPLENLSCLQPRNLLEVQRILNVALINNKKFCFSSCEHREVREALTSLCAVDFK